MFAIFSRISCPTMPLLSIRLASSISWASTPLASPPDREQAGRPGRHHRIKESSAREFKEQSNQFVRMGRKHYAEVVSSYTKAIAQIEPLSSLDAADASVLFANRAHVNLFLGNHRRSLEDAEQAIRLSPSSVKLFTTVRGKGAFLNGSPIKASSQDELVKALLVTEVGTKRDKTTLDDTTNRINKLLYKIRSIRMCGSLALNMCGVACGRLDLCYEMGFGGPWDVAAGAVILQEAGGHVFDPSGGEFDLMSRRMAGSNGLLKEKFVKELGDTN